MSGTAEVWLGGMDSNHDSQIQSLMSCQLDDLPAGGGHNKTPRIPCCGSGRKIYFIRWIGFRQPRAAVPVSATSAAASAGTSFPSTT